MTYNKNKSKPKNTVTTSSDEVKPEQFEEILDIKDANERSEELAKYDLTEGQKDAAEVAAREDFLGDSGVSVADEEEVKPLNNRAQKLVDELTAKGIGVSYPSDFSKWDASVYERLEKLNR